MQELIHYPLQIYRDKRVLFLTCATESSHWVGAFFASSTEKFGYSLHADVSYILNRRGLYAGLVRLAIKF